MARVQDGYIGTWLGLRRPSGYGVGGWVGSRQADWQSRAAVQSTTHVTALAPGNPSLGGQGGEQGLALHLPAGPAIALQACLQGAPCTHPSAGPPCHYFPLPSFRALQVTLSKAVPRFSRSVPPPPEHAYEGPVISPPAQPGGCCYTVYTERTHRHFSSCYAFFHLFRHDRSLFFGFGLVFSSVAC